MEEEKVLTQDEINALLQNVPAEEEAPQGKQAGTEARRHRKKDAPSRTLLPLVATHQLRDRQEQTLRSILDLFTDEMEKALTTEFRMPVEFHLNEVNHQSYGSFIADLVQPCSLWAIEMKPSGLSAILNLDAEMIQVLVDLVIGGDGSSPSQKRAISDLDQSVTEGILKLFLQEFDKAWNRILPLESRIVKRERKPEFLSVYTAAERLLSLDLRLKSSHFEATFTLALPQKMLKEIESWERENLKQEALPEPGAQSSPLLGVVGDVPLSLEAETYPTPVLVSELLGLKSGDVIRLEHRTSEPLTVTVNGQPRLNALMVLSNGHKALEIMRGGS